MQLFAGRRSNNRKSVRRIIESHSTLLSMMLENKERAVFDFERPDSRFRFSCLCLAAILATVQHKLVDPEAVETDATRETANICLRDPKKYFNGKVPPQEAHDLACKYVKSNLDRMSCFSTRIATDADIEEVAPQVCELIQGTESPDPIRPVDYKRLSRVAGDFVGLTVLLGKKI